MASLKLRDRDAIVTKEGLIFRVLGYSHPPDAYICDPEYAPSEVFKSTNPKAPRTGKNNMYYKFYEDEGWKLVSEKLPQYMLFHAMIGRDVVGVGHSDILHVKQPASVLRELWESKAKDELHGAMKNMLNSILSASDLKVEVFGVFGSLLHGFYHPKLSDIDLVIYGGQRTTRLRETLESLYEDRSSLIRNEFETNHSIHGKHWRFRNFSAQEYLWHQRRKLIYALFQDTDTRRTIKTEFEPIRSWDETVNGYDPQTRILQKGWVTVIAEITGDGEAMFIPSVYEIRSKEILDGPQEAIEARSVISFIEEFRMQALKGETVLVAGNLEQVQSEKESQYQISLTYCPRYYEQTLKVLR